MSAPGARFVEGSFAEVLSVVPVDGGIEMMRASLPNVNDVCINPVDLLG